MQYNNTQINLKSITFTFWLSIHTAYVMAVNNPGDDCLYIIFSFQENPVFR